MWKERTVERMAQTAFLLPQRPGTPSVEIDGFLRRKLMAFTQPSSALSLPLHFKPRGSSGHVTPEPQGE